MSDLSNYSENALLNHVYGGTAYSPAATLYLDLFSSSPDFEAGTGGTSVLGSGNRIAITNNTTNFPSATNGAKSNGAVIATSANAGSTWSIVSWGIYDASTSGNLLIGKTFGTTYTVQTGEIARFPVGSLTITFSGASNYLNSKLCDLMFGAVSYTAPATIYFAALTTAPGSYATMSGAVEASGGNYARASLTNNTTNFPNASGGAKTTGTQADFPTPDTNQGTWVAIVAYDASTSGNALNGNTLAQSKTATTGTPLNVAAGDFDATLS